MRIIAAFLLALAGAGIAAAQAPLTGDFDGDGRPDVVRVELEPGAGHERFRIIVGLAARPGETFFLMSGPADRPRSIEILPPGAYQTGTGRSAKELTLTTDSVKLTIEPLGQPPRSMLKIWDPDVPAFAGYSLPN